MEPASPAGFQEAASSARRRRLSIREAAIPRAADDAEDAFSHQNSEHSSFAPSFQEEWSPMFEEDRYQHMLPAIHVFCWIPAAYFSYVPLLYLWNCAWNRAFQPDAWQADLLLEAAKMLACCSAGIVFALASLRPFCVRNVDWLCAILAGVLYAAELAKPVLVDLRAREHLRDCATLGSGAEREACQHLSSQLRLQAFNIDYLLKCTFFTHLPMVLKMRAYQTWAFTGLVLAANVGALLVPGPVHWGLLANLVVQLAFLIPENVLLRMEEARAKQQFAYIMAIRFERAA